MNNPILTPLADYARQRGLSRQRIYKLKERLSIIELPVFVELSGLKIPLYKDRQPVTQLFVQQDRDQLQTELNQVNDLIRMCNGCDINRLQAMKKEIEFILK